MSTPQVSVLLPVRNDATHLPAAIASIQRQTLTDWELIVVDDGSTDGTTQWLQSAAEADRRLSIITQPALGLVPALNSGLKACNAPLVARMDSDDIAHPRRLFTQLNAFKEQPELTLCASAVRHFPRPHIQGGMLAYEKWQNRLIGHCDIQRNLFVESPFVHPSVMFKKQAVQTAGGYRKMPWAEDYDLWIRLAVSGSIFYRCPETLLYWRDRPERLTRTAENCTLDAFRACKVHFLSQSYLCNCQQVTLWGAGQEGKLWARALRDAGINVNRWIEVDPKKIGQRIHGAPVCEPDDLNTHPAKTLITVGARGARQQIRDWADQHRLIEGEHYLCVT
ncbi:MAG: glycosyl transferase [Desulfuromonas sp.]|nr:MAG: glycosyl transferase [Desulfuromonas sp.]